MNRVVLLATASVLALSTACASAMNPPASAHAGKVHPFRLPKGARILYNQNSNATGEAIDSQNFTSGTYSGANDQGADDFIVPEGTTWTITEVDVSGLYFHGSGPAVSENVTFYVNGFGEPGEPVKNGTFNSLKGKGKNGNFALKLPHDGVTLAPGTYWVSVVANCSYDGGCGEWGWETNSIQHGRMAMWQNPGCCWECSTWWTIEQCISGDPYPDFMFDLRGSAIRNKP